VTDELAELKNAREVHRHAIEQADAALRAAILHAYRAKRPDGTPAFTLAELGDVFGVTRQRAHQIVRESADQAG